MDRVNVSEKLAWVDVLRYEQVAGPISLVLVMVEISILRGRWLQQRLSGQALLERLGRRKVLGTTIMMIMVLVWPALSCDFFAFTFVA
jgi:hypothetical protein